MEATADELFDHIIDKTYQRKNIEAPLSSVKLKGETQKKSLKNTRWTDDQLALYVVFSFDEMKKYPISFKSDRRGYNSFDRQLC